MWAGMPPRAGPKENPLPTSSSAPAPDNERRDPVWVHRGEEDAHRSTSESPKERGSPLPAASITARTSSVRVSRFGAPLAGSDMPVPRLSKRISRENGPRVVMNCPPGISQSISMWERARRHDKVERPVACHLVGDLDVTADRVPRLGSHWVDILSYEGSQELFSRYIPTERRSPGDQKKCASQGTFPHARTRRGYVFCRAAEGRARPAATPNTSL